MLGEIELKALAEDIEANGLHEPIWLWADPATGEVFLLDGRNRDAACELIGLTPGTRFYEGDDPLGFVVSENIRRRHLTLGQLAMLGVEIKRRRSEDARENLREAGRVKEPFQNSGKASIDATREAAREVGVSHDSITKAEKLTKAAPDLAVQVSAGTIALNRAERIVRDREAQERKIAEAIEDAKVTPIRASLDIRHGDFREVLADLHNVDAIITDPPYPHEYIPLLADLGSWADRVLAPEGVLAVLMGQTYLPEVYRLLDGHRPYRWTLCYYTPGPGYVSHARHIQSNWKPVLVYGGGPRLADVVLSEGTDADAKSHHKWGQDYSAFHTLISRLTRPGQTVVDPFMGSGTTLLAAHALGRHAIGCDVDETHVVTARERLGA